jgi:hypothetical protein
MLNTIIPLQFLHTKRMVDLKEQHVCIKLCFRLENTMLQKVLNVESSFWQADGEKHASF